MDKQSVTLENSLSSDKWKILIVDDESTIHSISKKILQEMIFQNKSLAFIDTFSEEATKRVLDSEADIAVILLDIVMEKDNSGLNIIKYIRDELKNKFIRIIVRTGQPEEVPERYILINYDVNDYRLKSELSPDRLFASVFAALRSYQELVVLDQKQKGLEKIIQSTTKLFKVQSFKAFISEVLLELSSHLQRDLDTLNFIPSGWEASKKDGSFIIEAAMGEFEADLDKDIAQILPPQTLEKILEVVQSKSHAWIEDAFVLFFEGFLGIQNLLYLKTEKHRIDWDKDLFGIFCSTVSLAYDNFYLSEEINSTQKEIIFTLGEIAESRSHETGFHVKRVAEYTKLLALELGLSEEEADMVSIASTMHDVGKLAVPDAILNKPGKLSLEEFEVIKTHTTVGYNMLKKSKGKVIKLAAIIAYQHHEKYNGKGYPQGLSGSAIHLYARIVAIADVFDALSSKRVYKEAWDLSEIVALLKVERGEHFDPLLTDIFLRHMDKVEKIMNLYQD